MVFGYDPTNAQRRLSLQSEATYGPDVGLPRILDLLDSRGVRATFFVPGYTAERHRDVVAEAARRGHEVAHHGYFHERPDLLDEDAEKEVLKKGSEILGEITGKNPRGYRAPSWEMSERTPGLLREYGLVYDSSLMGDDEPYSISGRKNERLLEIPVHWTNDDWVHFGFCSSPQLGNGISSPSKVYEMWREEFQGYYRYGGCFVLTMHPFVIGRPSRMRLLERMIGLIQGTEKVWIATLEEIADYVITTGQGRYRPRADMSRDVGALRPPEIRNP